MFRKLNTKILLIALVVLLAVVVGVYLSDQRKGERTFKEYLVQANADEIDQIQLFPKSLKGKQIDLKKSGRDWTVSQDGKSYPADNNAITGLISSLNPLKPESVVSSNPKHWKEFDLTDSLATRVKLMKGSNVEADLIIGKFEMASSRSASTYARLADDNVVYSVEGFLSMNVNRNMDSFRSHKVVDGNKADWSKLEFTYPKDSSFVLEKQSEGKWHIGTQDVNATDVDNFLNSLQHLTHYKFSAQLPPSKPVFMLKITGSKLAQPIEVDGYEDGSGNVVITSSQNNGNLFDGKDLMAKVFPGQNVFFKTEKKK